MIKVSDPVLYANRFFDFRAGLVKVSLCKAGDMYDILVESLNIACLEKAKKMLNSEQVIYKRGYFNSPFFVFDSFSSVDDAMCVFLKLELK